MRRRMPTPLPAEDALWYWCPQRFGVRFAPESFLRELWTIWGDQVTVTWHPLRERWLGWAKIPRLAHGRTRGWQLLFVVETSWGAFVPLDERTIAAFASRSAIRTGGSQRYFDRIQSEIRRDWEKRQQDPRADERRQWVRDRWEYGKPKIAMRGPSVGSKMANHDSRMAG